MHQARDFFINLGAERTWPADFASYRLANPIEHSDQHGEKPAFTHAHRSQETSTNETRFDGGNSNQKISCLKTESQAAGKSQAVARTSGGRKISSRDRRVEESKAGRSERIPKQISCGKTAGTLYDLAWESRSAGKSKWEKPNLQAAAGGKLLLVTNTKNEQKSQHERETESERHTASGKPKCFGVKIREKTGARTSTKTGEKNGSDSRKQKSGDKNETLT
jgi:hypothetical protein